MHNRHEDSRARAVSEARDAEMAALKKALKSPIPLRLPFNAGSLELHKAVAALPTKAGKVVPITKPVKPAPKPSVPPARPAKPLPAAAKASGGPAYFHKHQSAPARLGDALRAAVRRF